MFIYFSQIAINKIISVIEYNWIVLIDKEKVIKL